MSYVNLHTHSDYSLLDGASQLPQLIDRAVELGMEAIALTDHGVMYGAIQLIKLCRSKGITPIIGNEMYVINGDFKDKKIKHKKYHQIVLAKNTEGYKNLVKLTTTSHLDGFQGAGIFARPCINKEYLETYREGLIVTSGCMAGEVPQNILKGDLEQARKTAKWYKKIFGEDYYLEIQDHGYPEDRIINVAIVKIAKELNIKIIATNDSHFTSCLDVDSHDALLCINTKKQITEEKRMRYSGTEYLKSAEEMKKLFRDHLEDEIIEEAIANTLEVAKKVKNYDLFGEMRIPNYSIPGNHTPATYLEEVTWKGLIERLKVKNKEDILRNHLDYEERLKYELSMIEKMGFSTYFLVVWDYVKFARDNNIPVGPGRGSAAGSLVAYALKITNIDPVHHGLLFERFLNPERNSMPDIDTDFSIDRRDEMIKYVTEKYGKEKVAQIITFNRMTSKAVLKDVARVLGVSYGEADKMAKMIPVSRGKPAKLKVMISDETPTPEFKEAYDKKMVSITNPKGEPAGEISVRQWIDMAIGIEGTNRTFGVHAAGVLISKDPLDEIVPLQKNDEGAVITQYYMEDLEMLGLLKMDFLGLKNLTIIQNTARAISQNNPNNIPFDAENLPADERKAMEILAKGSQKKLPEDVKNTYKLIASGDLEGVFQLESSGMMDVVRQLKPSSIEDISSILALYRPGPLDAGLIPKFIDRKHGREEIKYDHVLLEPILNETYGVLCYQEQIMKMAQDLAGYSLGQADLLRRCLSGDTEVVDVATGNLVKISEIADRPEYWLGRKLFSLDLNSQEIVAQPISEIHRNGRQSVWEITTRTNRKIKATQEHLFYTVLGWKPLGVLQKGDRLGLAKRLPINNAAEISDAQIKLSAYLIGDGHLSTKAPSCSYFCNSDEELIADFNRCAEELFGSPAPTDAQLHPGRKSVTYARIGFVSAFNHWVDNHLKRARSEHKEIPSWVFSLSKKQLQLFLGTLWSTDGSFDTAIGHTDYTSTSPVLIKQIQHLCLRLGIVALFNTKKAKYKGKPHFSYRAQITGPEDMLKFCELIQPYLSSYKQKLCQTSYLAVKDKLKNQSKHTIPPEIITIIGRAKKTSGMTWRQIDGTLGFALGTMSSGLNFQKAPTRSLSRHRVRNFAMALQDEQLMAIADSEIFWDEIISIEYVGVEEVFDLSIPQTHNFVANDFVVHNCMGKKKVAEMEKHREKFIDGATKKGVPSRVAENLFEQMIKFAEYCFNKSHSTAYAYVSYQTAYLKANYPVEYMSALLTANSGDQDKVQKYIANCQRLKIEIEPPDINRSQVDFTPLPKSGSEKSKGKILFGFSAVKNLGEAAIMQILKAREEKGEFTSLAELCDRVHQQALNSRALESLIYCGAFDKLEPNRKKLISELPEVIVWAQKRHKEREIGQLNLFDMGAMGVAESANAFESAPQKTGVEDYPVKEKLNKEKDILGFYVSDHPLKYVTEANPVEGALEISQLKDKEKKAKGVVKVVAMVAAQKLHTTKSGDRMAFLQIEDMSGQMEAIVFPKIFEEVRPLLEEPGAVLLLTGKAETKDDEVQLLVDEAKRIQEEMAEAVEKSSQLEIEGEGEAIASEVEAPREELAPEEIEETEKEPPPPSEHPAKLARGLKPDPNLVLVEALEGKPEKCGVKAIGKLTRVKVITTKNGDEMAFVEIEDETGKVDVTVFPGTYQQFKHLLEWDEEEERVFLVTGKTQKHNDRVKLVADKLEILALEELPEETSPPPPPPEEFFEEFAAKKTVSATKQKAIVVQLTPQQVADGERLELLKTILQEYAANQENAVFLVAAMVVGKSCRQLVRFDRRFWMETPEIIDRLQGLNFDVGMLDI